ncbi:MAG: VOC family protein [Phycisphaerales bacterium]|nr:VOC family protein [Phycisphaerales bacterium]MCI0631263.1 VOC family protein [Phycisphaerales bacterium]MCI0676854.1 VOC family protein [Phycisphaerales bacterium]
MKRKGVAKRAHGRARASSQITRKATATKAAPPPPPPGSIVWHELMTTDVKRCRDFYTKLFGWKTSEMEMMPGFVYTMFENKGQGIGGMMQITAEHGEMRPHWDVYVGVRDVDATAQQCEALGGEIVIPPHDIPVGRWSMLKDPSGSMIAIYKSKRKS